MSVSPQSITLLTAWLRPRPKPLRRSRKPHDKEAEEARPLETQCKSASVVSAPEPTLPAKSLTPSAPRQPTIDEMLCSVDLLDGPAFERWCARLLEKISFLDIQLTKSSGDQGVDIVAFMDDVWYAIQCKCYSSDLGNHPIQEVHAGKNMYHCHVCVVMTNRYFTSGAKELAQATGTLLWDRDKLKSILQGIQNENNSGKA